MKKNLEIPPTFKGAKMAKHSLHHGPGGRAEETMEDLMLRRPGCASSPVLKALGPAKRGIA